MREDRDVIVVGAGIIGICIAAYLSESGCRVTAIDRSGVCEETSSGNAAGLAFSEILPLAHKGMMRQLPRWLADPLGPFSIPPSYLPKLVPWLARFVRAGRQGNRSASLEAQTALMRLSQTEWMALMNRSGTRPMLREDGSLELYESESEFSAAKTGWDERSRAGIEYDHVRGVELAALQPGLSSRFVAGTFVPGWKTVSDPKELGKALWAYCERLGARFEQADVVNLEVGDDAVTAVTSSGERFGGSCLIVAAGAWSHLLAQKSGDVIPLETERGYNTTLPADAFDLKRQLTFSKHGFVITPLENGIRVGGAVELGGLELAPNYKRSKAMLAKASRFLPGLKTDGGREWMGYRPSLPDSLPVIGRSRLNPGIFYAFGHGHLGLTQAAATGRLINDIVLRQTLPIDINPFQPQRFGSFWRATASFA